MKFLNVGLFGLSALVATSAAAPAPALPVSVPDLPSLPIVGSKTARGEVKPDAEIIPALPLDTKLIPRADVKPVLPELPVVGDKLPRADILPVPEVPATAPALPVVPRTFGKVHEILANCVSEVKTHTGKINSTMSAHYGYISEADKTGLIAVIKAEVVIIIQLITGLAHECVGLVGTTVEKVEQEAIVKLVLELIFEILYTLKNVIAILKITIFELLGNLIFGLIVAIGHLLVILDFIVAGLLKLVFGVLANVIGLLSVVLKGLLPIVLGIVGVLLGKVSTILGCILY